MNKNTTKFRVQSIVVVSDANGSDLQFGKARYSFDETIESIEDLPSLMNGMAKAVIKQIV